MSQDRHHTGKGYLCDTNRVNHQGHADHPSAFVSGQTHSDSVVHSLNHAPSSWTVERELMRTSIEGRKLDYPCDPTHGNPQSELDPKPSVLGTSERERSLRRKPKCEDLRAKAAYQAKIEKPAHIAVPVFESPKLRASAISLPQQRYDSPVCLVAEPPEQERDPNDGRRTRRGHRATERPFSSSPSLNTPIDPRVETKPRNKLNHDPRFAGHTSQQSHSRPDAQTAGEHRAQGAGFLTSQEWQQHPTTYGPGSPYEIARTLRRTIQPQELIMYAEEEKDSNTSTLVGETPFNPIAGLEGFDGVPTIRGEGYHYPQKHHHSPTSPLDQSPLGVAATEGVPYEDTFAEETLLQNVPAHVLRAGSVARARRGYRASSSSHSAGSSDDETQQEIIRARVPDFTLIPAFEEYSLPAFSWQRRSSRMTEETSMGLRQLVLSLYEYLCETDW